MSVLALAGIAVSLMQTLVIPIISELPALLDSAPTNTAWAVTATLLAGAIVTPSPDDSVTSSANDRCSWSASR